MQEQVLQSTESNFNTVMGSGALAAQVTGGRLM